MGTRRHFIVRWKPTRVAGFVGLIALPAVGVWFMVFRDFGADSGVLFRRERVLPVLVIGLALLAFVVLPIQFRNRWSFLAGDDEGMWKATSLGTLRLGLDGDLTDATLEVEDLDSSDADGSRLTKGMLRFTVRCGSRSVSANVGKKICAPGYEERFDEWKQDWLAHNHPVGRHEE